MRTVADLVAHVEGRFMCIDGRPRAACETGDRYVTIGEQSVHAPAPEFPGTVDEGRPAEPAFDEETACHQARACFDAYAESRGRGWLTRLYWRQRPKLECWGDGDKRRCRVYMRLVITDKPPIASAA